MMKSSFELALERSGGALASIDDEKKEKIAAIADKDIATLVKLLLLKNGKNTFLKNLIIFVIKNNEAKVPNNQGK